MFTKCSMGAFDDLMLYMENDPEWQKADYIKPVMDGVQYQGQQFVMPITYTIPMMLSTEEILKENNIALTSESNADEIITEWEKYWKNTNPLTGKPLSLRPSMYYSFDQWFHLGIVDFENQKVDLNSPYIKKMADAFQYGYELEDVHSINGGVNIGENMNSLKEQKLTSIVCEYDLDDYYRAVYHLDTMGTPAVIPMRDAEGKIHVEVRFMAGINANSQNKELAWEFIKCILSEENQYGITEDLTEQGTPVNKEACRRMGEDVFCKGGISVTDPFFGTYGIVLDHSYYEKFTAIQNDIASSYMLFPGFGITFNHIRKVAAGEETYEEAMKRVKSYYTIYVSE